MHFEGTSSTKADNLTALNYFKKAAEKVCLYRLMIKSFIKVFFSYINSYKLMIYKINQ